VKELIGNTEKGDNEFNYRFNTPFLREDIFFIILYFTNKILEAKYILYCVK